MSALLDAAADEAGDDEAAADDGAEVDEAAPVVLALPATAEVALLRGDAS